MVKATEAPDFAIFSGAYIGDEMAAEFGLIPPSFLPLGGKRLFEHQAELAQGKIFLSLPENFEIPAVDQRRLDKHSIKVIRVPTGLSLRAAALHTLTSIGSANGIEVIFGDTLVNGHCLESTDLVSYQNDPAHHFWSYFSDDDAQAPFVQGFGDGITERRILCGHFRFSKPALLIESLNDAPDFVQALNRYEQKIPFKKRMVKTWFDFGHLSLFHQSKRNFSVSRVFNSIESDGKSVRKSSNQTSKIRAEAYWYEHLPNELKLHVPKFLGRDDQDFQAGYRMEYVYLPLLSDLYVFGRLPQHVWSQIMSSCFDFLNIARQQKPESNSPEMGQAFSDNFFSYMFINKTKSRLAEFLASRSIGGHTKFVINNNVLPPISDIVDQLLEKIRPTEPSDISFLHGDFFFGNTFFDFRSTQVTVIDPRAMLGDGDPTLFGDHRYDVAKLAHSVIGGYDHIINGRSILEKESATDWSFSPTDIALPHGLDDLILKTALNSYNMPRAELLGMTALLFYSMLPLHSDSSDRQTHLFANALRLTVDALEAS